MAANDASGQRLQSAPKKKGRQKSFEKVMSQKHIFSILTFMLQSISRIRSTYNERYFKECTTEMNYKYFFFFIYRPDQNPLRFSNAAYIQFKIPAKFTMQRATARAWWSDWTSSVGNRTATWYALARTRSIRRCRVAKLKLLQAWWSSQNIVCLATTIPISNFTI